MKKEFTMKWIKTLNAFMDLQFINLHLGSKSLNFVGGLKLSSPSTKSLTLEIKTFLIKMLMAIRFSSRDTENKWKSFRNVVNLQKLWMVIKKMTMGKTKKKNKIKKMINQLL